MKDKHYSSSSSLALKTLYECVRTLNILVSKTGKKATVLLKTGSKAVLANFHTFSWISQLYHGVKRDEL